MGRRGEDVGHAARLTARTGAAVIRSTDRILTTHAGALPRPADLRELIVARGEGRPFDAAMLERRLRESVAETVDRQLECGVDSLNDGELSKTNFTNYVRERLSGFETRLFKPGEGPAPLSIASREMAKFSGFFNRGGKGFGGFAGAGPSKPQVFCVSPLKYVGQEALKTDLDNLSLIHI